MKILIACEKSEIVCKAFRKKGHNAWSCDTQVSEDYYWPFHIKGDVLRILDGHDWDMMIAHPPCTHLSVSGARWFNQKYDVQKDAINFFFALTNAPIRKICIENPIGVMSSYFRKPNKVLDEHGWHGQIIQPWQFGHGETKATCLWLKNLPLLKPTNIVEGREHKIHKMAPGPNRSADRARTYQGIADAMAEQWG